MANFDYAFWNLHPNILAHGEHNAYEDGALLNVTYKHKKIS